MQRFLPYRHNEEAEGDQNGLAAFHHLRATAAWLLLPMRCVLAWSVFAMSARHDDNDTPCLSQQEQTHGVW
jgi:hypothetical protein